MPEYKNFISIDARAEETGLKEKSIDLIISGQAFHWFDVEKAKKEFNRILKEDGRAVLFWNARKVRATGFLIEYESLLKKFGNEYETAGHRNLDDKIFENFFNTDGYRLEILDNSKYSDFEELKGGLLSASYIPLKGEENYDRMISDLERLFKKFNIDNKVKLEWNTKIYYGKIG
jgi:SAM-dependent methyltransferase